MAILVLSSGGKVGQELVRSLHREKADFAAASTDPAKAKHHWDFPVKALRLAYGDASDMAALPRTLREGGLTKLFLVLPQDKPGRYLDVLAFLDRALESGIREVVFMSALGAQFQPDDPMRKIELYLESAGVAHSVLHPNWFMQNFSSAEDLRTIRNEGFVELASGSAKFAFIDTRDIADCAAALLMDGVGQGKEFTLCGSDVLSYADAAATIAKVAGYPVEHRSQGSTDALEAMRTGGVPQDFVEFYRWLFADMENGRTARTDEGVQNLLGRPPRRFADFVKDYAAVWKR